MKSAINMLEDISGQLTENISLLEFIYRDSPDMGETDNALSCLIRSMLKTSEQAQDILTRIILKLPDRRNLLHRKPVHHLLAML